MITLTREKPRYGYRQLHVLLRRERIEVNFKRLWRLYRASGWGAETRRMQTLGTCGLVITAAMARFATFYL